MSLTYDEIKQTRESTLQTIGYVEGRMPEIEALFRATEPRHVVYIGCGSSYSLAKSCARMHSYTGNIPSSAIAAGDLMLNCSRYAAFLEGSVVITLSRSGSTSEAVEALKLLRERAKVRVLSIVCAEKSPLEAESDLTLVMPWAFDHSVCQTRCVTCLYTAGAVMIARLSGRGDILASLRYAAESSGDFIDTYEDQFKEVAKLDFSRAVVLADGEIEGIAEEGALAFNEICQLPSNYYHVLDSRHGPMVLIRKGTLVIAALADGGKYEQDLIRDVLNKGAEVITYSDRPVKIEGVRYHFTGAQPMDMIARGVPFILICQLVSLFKSAELGTDPDRPDGLDAWIRL